MDLKLNQDQLSQIIAGAILSQITDEMRADIIKQAIVHLTTPVKDQYGRASSETSLQRAFNLACDRVAYDVANDYVATHPEFRAAMTKAMEYAAAEALANIDEVREKLAESVVQALWQKHDR